MNSKESKRTYNMSKRAEAAAETEKAIFDAATDLWREHHFADVTLDAIADRAGVSVRTVIRRYGSKEGVFEAGIENSASNIQVKRDLERIVDLEEALNDLLEDYETFGDAMTRTLAIEDQIKAAKNVLEAGRGFHRQWCEHAFVAYLPGKDAVNYEERLTAFVAATDLYLWKLLRRDLNKNAAMARSIFKELLEGLIKK